MPEKSPPFARYNTLARRLCVGATIGALALTATALLSPPAYDARQELPSRQTIGTVTITHSSTGVRIITDAAAAEDVPQVTSYCRGRELVVIKREPPPAGIPLWDQIRAFEKDAEAYPDHPNCDDGLLVASEYPDPLATN